MTVRALLLDLEGTVFQSGALIPGAAEALAEATRRGVAWRFVTNATSRPRSVILRELSAMGLDIEPDRLFTAPRAAQGLIAARGWTRCHFLLRPALLEDFDGLEAVEEGAEAVVLGDLGSGMTYERLNRAFRMLLDGAELVTLARNRYWQANDGLMLDTGPFCAALEHASGKKAILAGKPSPAFFQAALASTGAAPSETAVVGDDLESDVGGAQRAGMRGVLVRTGKHRPDDLRQSPVRPDAVLASIAELPTLLD
ncbi:MAG: TIGR01458 family HAD-type hydrolase [Thermoanaerobaculia bacterium]|jgi:HAD superfamily hydrolase (TIGR01458 family)